MKNLYWRPQKVSKIALLLIAVVSCLGIYVVEQYPEIKKQSYYNEKLKASRLALDMMSAIKLVAAKQGRIDQESDPAGSGLIGQLMTSITSNTGYLESKQTTINPNFAAVVVELLKKAGVTEGDRVAVGISGSFPALNINVLAALETLKLRPVIISSGASSQWGANTRNLTWFDMEKILFDKELISFRSVAASVGGVEDRGLGLNKNGREFLKTKISSLTDIEFLQPTNYAESVEMRMATYAKHVGKEPVRVFINVGGGTASVGKKEGKLLFKPGLNKVAPFGTSHIDSVMTRFVQDGIPVIHFSSVKKLAENYGLPLAPRVIPAPGEGKIFVREQVNLVLVFGVLLTILGCLAVFIKSDIGYRLFNIGSSSKKTSQRPEAMV